MGCDGALLSFAALNDATLLGLGQLDMVAISQLCVLEDIDEPIIDPVGGDDAGGNGAGAGGGIVQNIEEGVGGGVGQNVEEGVGGGAEVVGSEDVGGV